MASVLLVRLIADWLLNVRWFAFADLAKHCGTHMVVSTGSGQVCNCPPRLRTVLSGAQLYIVPVIYMHIKSLD